MANHPHRGRINCAPLSIRPHHGLLMGLPKTVEPLAYVYSLYPLAPEGLLIRMKYTAQLCKWIGGAIQSIDQRKAQLALNMMQQRIDENYDWHDRNDTKPTSGPSDKGSARGQGHS